MSDFDEISSEPRWYVAHTYSGYENKVKANLEKIIENRGLQDVIMDIRIPVETVREENGIDEEGNAVVKEVENKIFPGYVLVKMKMSDATWHVVRNIRGVTGFVGPGSKPVPLSEEEVAAIIKDEPQVTTTTSFGIGDRVNIVDGAFRGYSGTLTAYNEATGEVTVVVPTVGRDIPVNLDKKYIEKAND